MDDIDEPGRRGWFLTAAGAVGDLGNPFYGEERRRDVWNEASAVGLQVALWLGTAGAAAMVWLGGRTALPYALAVLAVVGAAGGVSVAYAVTLGVRPDDDGRVLRPRLLPYAALLALLLAGAVRVAPDDGFGAGFAWGAVLGAVAVVLWMVRSDLRARREERRAGV